ncbi:complex I NDUFA9 subunit family protein [Sphingorhabdus sp.]|jgi:NADH dehydrogenase|uniref:complex I NDUFA9 subunit family protein n=1 Tax=Sphingorhabdus sp. TaxID=1902408 RepID=UPI0011D85448|nr:complex I NDUFA9 subunit family protein [Sphingorhabdus sp.]TXH19915.1 MAG: complex I NDUFA9 subunit family protein [Gammaproteobacteria bacterium]HMT40380.1 complex I NDUFA9 subunit family protein [Sphingorhabdus sp.]
MSDLNGKLVTVFGGGGFVGRYVVQALCAAGARVRVAVRDTRGSVIVKPLGNLGQVSLCACDITKPATVANALVGADMAVNLVGSFDNLDAIQRAGAANVAHAAAKAGVSALVHMSAIGADAESTAEYGRSKAGGEAAVRAAFPNATILRPSIIFGREDAFINRFAGLIRMLPIVPVIGAETKFQPVFVGDVARAVVAALGRSGGETLELGGPQVFSMLQLNEWIAKATGHNKLFVPVPDAAAKLLTLIPGGPISGDQLKMLAYDNVVSGADGLAALGITATPIDAVAHDWMTLYRKHGRFGDAAAA